ncbi:MAG: hypothetical protein KG003_07475 [Bacteroidetes bacterium]|nr:hypothetical protein [Bacteroidota bacterium]
MLQKHRTLIIIITAGLMLAGLVAVFGSTAGLKLEHQTGWHFTDVHDLQISKSRNNPIAQKKIAPKRLIRTDSLSQKEISRLDTLKLKQTLLENFAIGKDKTCLDAFFTALDKCGDSVVHIWYYGDSQIEADRVTGELRDMMQSRFGGSGTGYVPLSDLATFRYFEMKTGPSLVKLNCFNNRGNKGFGFAGKVYKFNVKDSAFKPTTGIKVSKALRYSKLYLTYGQHNGGIVKMYGADSQAISVSIPMQTTSGRILLSDKGPHGNLKFSLPSNGNYFGLMFEGNKGIQIDNCGIRGHSGDGLKYISDAVLNKDAAMWNAKLIVFSFGNNMIPVLKSGKKNMDFYTRYFEGIFSKFRKAIPDASILVISAGDMGTVIQGEETGYPNVAEFVEAMRVAAMNTGCAFFDAHAMIAKDGGILGWKKYGYAGLDGHLSLAGQRKYAKEIYSSLIYEYEMYQILHTSP